MGVVAKGEGLALRLRGFSASTSRSRITSLMLAGKAGDVGCESVNRRIMLTRDWAGKSDRYWRFSLRE